MDWGQLIFSLCLLIPGLWLILRVSRDLKESAWLDDQWRIEQERKAALRGRRHASPRSIPHIARAPVAAAQPVTEATELALAGSSDTASRNNIQADPWQSMTTLDIGAAFRSFLRETSHPCDDITASQVTEAFEKFLGQVRQSISV